MGITAYKLGLINVLCFALAMLGGSMLNRNNTSAFIILTMACILFAIVNALMSEIKD